MFVGGAQFILAVIVGEALHAGYTVFSGHLSDLGAEPYSAVFNSSVLIVGIFFIGTSYYARKAFPDNHLLANLLLVSGVGPILVGVFSENAISNAGSLGINGLAGLFGVLHYIGAVIAYLFGGLAAVVSRKLARQPLSGLFVVLGVLTLAFLVLNLSGVHTALGPGGIQRMIVYPELIWAIGLGGHLMGREETVRSIP